MASPFASAFARPCVRRACGARGPSRSEFGSPFGPVPIAGRAAPNRPRPAAAPPAGAAPPPERRGAAERRPDGAAGREVAAEVVERLRQVVRDGLASRREFLELAFGAHAAGPHLLGRVRVALGAIADARREAHRAVRLRARERRLRQLRHPRRSRRASPRWCPPARGRCRGRRASSPSRRGWAHPPPMSSLNWRSARMRRARTFSAQFGSPLGPSPTPGGKRIEPSALSAGEELAGAASRRRRQPRVAAAPGFMFR